MTDTAVADGLMPHQKDEHDIWICKDCGWKYPNAKPSPKIRKNHKKHCSGKAGAEVHDGGSSDDAASDDEHHSSREEGVAPNQTAEDSPVSTVESKNRSFDFAAATAKEDVNGEAPPPAAAVNRNVKEEAAHGDVSTPAIAEKKHEKVEVDDKKAPLASPVSASPGGLMPHQKDEHDVWICKDCGWKYPNAKPSSKVRKHHKKQCPGKGGPGVGGSSDEASDDEHHHAQHDNLITPDVKSKEQAEISSKDDLNKPRSFEAATASEEVNKEQAEISSKDDLNKPRSFGAATASEEVKDTSENKGKEELSSGTPQATGVGGLMPHQKDENDIWICKDCGWKYPNAKPSSKIRKHHKKQCTGKGQPQGGQGSSDEASDDEHHHGHHDHLSTPAAPARLGEAENGSGASGGAEPVPKISREFPRETPSSEVVKQESTAAEEALPIAAEAGPEPAGLERAAPEEISDKEVPELKMEEQPQNSPPENLNKPASSEAVTATAEAKDTPEIGKEEEPSSGLMPHQKDENDIWICKDCGWKYPNAKPSGKVRKHHKKQCPGKGGPKVGGGSSDEDSDDEHHHRHLPTPPAFKESPSPDIVKDEGTSAEAPPAMSRDIDFEALKESGNPEAVKDESTVAEAGPPIAATEEVNDTSEEIKRKEDSSAGTPEAAVVGGLMPHQKDEHDIWTCKDCGWKYPNAKPSGKVRKHHKKQCPGKGGSTVGGGSSDEASDDEQHHRHLPTPAAFKESPSPDMVKEEGTSAEAPPAISRDIDFEALKESANPEVVKDGSTVAEEFPPIAEAGTQKDADTFGEEESSKRPGGTTTGAVSFKEAILKEPKMEEGDPKKPVSLREAIDKESKQEMESKSEPTEATIASGGLLPHQKDEADVWVCKACGWKYPNAKPSPKIKKNHKKKCPGNTSGGAVVAGESSDEGTDNEQRSTTEKVVAKNVEELTPAVPKAKASGVAVVGDVGVISREFSLASAVQGSNTAPTCEAGVPVMEKDNPMRSTNSKEAPEIAVGGSMSQQKDEADIWVCKDCGWRYPNAKPSPKVRKNHKNKCPGKGGAAKRNDSRSSDDASSDDDKFKCFRCLS